MGAAGCWQGGACLDTEHTAAVMIVQTIWHPEISRKTFINILLWHY